MLDDEFENIEDFLKSGDNPELQFFSTFEKITSDLVDQQFKNRSKEDFTKLHELILESYLGYNTNNNNVMKDFSILIIICKKVLEMLNTTEINDLFTEEQKQVYLRLLKDLIKSIKEEITHNLNYFEVFNEYTNGILNIIPVEN